MLLALTEFLSLFKYWRMWLIVGILGSIIGGIGYVYWDINHLKAQVATDKTNIAALTSVNTQQKQALDSCSANTAQLKADSDALQKQAAAAQFAALMQAQPHFDSAKTIMATKPAQGQNDYEATQTLINSFIPASRK